ncbi:multiple coagulation factor deficiency protein 2 homolog isoform X4 [Sitophilus oryzae]|uniref:Multiple coagulation factor deficiency protein 2 homolog isoform X4 n=1 Tax=Sitophilus oryzae TaxID=7048 RepID=A0A6J2Y101_SITOR|nr:multiple coagulation factor deficiency protein 2 homolog isoform X4 [Sitophilus oryzae]
MNSFLLLLSIFSFVLIVRCQRAPPGVNPQHYQHQQYQAPQQYQQVPQQQYQVPQQQFQQAPQRAPTQQQVPQKQAPQQPVQHQQVPQAAHDHAHHGQQHLLNAQNIAQEKDHIAEHLNVPLDTSKMSEQEIQFHYFKMHDSDNNNKLDGCELIKSLIHWHEEGSKEKQGQIEEKIFKDEELVNLIDPILNVDDGNRDGYIDYPEFIKAQQKAAGQPQQNAH